MKLKTFGMAVIFLVIGVNVKAATYSRDIVGTVGPAIAYSTENELGYGAEVHACTPYLNGSLEYFFWNAATDGNTDRLRGYVGVGLFYLLQFQGGFGEGGDSLRLRSNITVVDLLVLVTGSHSRFEGWPIIMLSGYAEYEFEEKNPRYGFGIGLPFMVPAD